MRVLIFLLLLATIAVATIYEAQESAPLTPRETVHLMKLLYRRPAEAPVEDSIQYPESSAEDEESPAAPEPEQYQIPIAVKWLFILVVLALETALDWYLVKSLINYCRPRNAHEEIVPVPPTVVVKKTKRYGGCDDGALDNYIPLRNLY